MTKLKALKEFVSKTGDIESLTKSLNSELKKIKIVFSSPFQIFVLGLCLVLWGL